MERRVLESYSGACFLCPARTFSGGKYVCDPGRLDTTSINTGVARLRPDSCPQKNSDDGLAIAPEVLLRRMLRR